MRGSHRTWELKVNYAKTLRVLGSKPSLYDGDIEFPVGVYAWRCLTPALDIECHSLISRHPCCLDIHYGAWGGWGAS